MRRGGIVAGHDYIEFDALTVGNRNFTDYNVKKAVDDFVKENNISYLFVFTKDMPAKNLVDERIAYAPSWFYVKT